MAILQLSSTDDVADNLKQTFELVNRAADQGAAFIALPENYGFLRREGLPYPCAQDVDGEIVGAFRSLVRDRSVWILGGSFPEAIPDSSRVYNCSVLVTPSAKLSPSTAICIFSMLMPISAAMAEVSGSRTRSHSATKWSAQRPTSASLACRSVTTCVTPNSEDGDGGKADG